MSYIPRPDLIIDAVLNCNFGSVSAAQIATLFRVWPKESNLDDFLREELQPEEIWDKCETYFMSLLRAPNYPQSILNRLGVFVFKE